MSNLIYEKFWPSRGFEILRYLRKRLIQIEVRVGIFRNMAVRRFSSLCHSSVLSDGKRRILCGSQLNLRQTSRRARVKSSLQHRVENFPQAVIIVKRRKKGNTGYRFLDMGILGVVVYLYQLSKCEFDDSCSMYCIFI